MPPDIPQQRDVAQLVEPIGVVDHDGVGRRLAEAQELGEGLADAGHVAGDLRVVEQRPRLVAKRRVTDPRRAAAHQRDRLVSRLLIEAQQHDADKVADMQAVGGTIVTEIGSDRSREQQRVERRLVGALVDVTALVRGGEKGRFG